MLRNIKICFIEKSKVLIFVNKILQKGVFIANYLVSRNKITYICPDSKYRKDNKFLERNNILVGNYCDKQG